MSNFELRERDPSGFIAMYCVSGRGKHEDLWQNFQMLTQIYSDLVDDNVSSENRRTALHAMNVILGKYPSYANIHDRKEMARWIAETTILSYEDEMKKLAEHAE